MIKPFITVLGLFICLLISSYFAPSIVTPVMVISFSFSLLKAVTVIAVARFVLSYLDTRTGIDVNGWVKYRASNDNRAVYFSTRFAAVFIVFGFIMA